MDKILGSSAHEPDGTLGRAAQECLGVAASLGTYEIAISGGRLPAAAAGIVGAALCVEATSLPCRAHRPTRPQPKHDRASVATLVRLPARRAGAAAADGGGAPERRDRHAYRGP